MRVSVEVFADEAWAERTAERFIERSPQNACLATGATMSPFLNRIAISDLSNTTVFLLDEFGGLAPDDPARCKAMIRRDLVDKSKRPPTIQVPSTDPPDPAGYQSLIDQHGLDLAVVGLGANGHIGMNEPGSNADSSTRVVQLEPSTSDNANTYGARTRPTWGVTVGMAPLLKADEIWLMVTGRHKRSILERVLKAPIGPDIPATFLRNHSGFTVFADAKAAG